MIADYGYKNMSPEVDFDPHSDRWVVTFRSDWDLYTQSLSSDGTVIDGARALATGPGTHHFDPGIAYVPAWRQFITSFGDTDESFFDEKGYLNAQNVLANGHVFGPRLYLDQSYEWLRRTEVAADPTRNLAAILGSGTGGVYLNLVQQDIADYEENCIGSRGGTVAIDLGDRGDATLRVPAGAVTENHCVDFYVSAGDSVVPKSASDCRAMGPSFYVGTQQPIELSKPLELEIPFDARNYTADDVRDRISHSLICRSPVKGAVGVHHAQVSDGHAKLSLEAMQVCQVIRCDGVREAYDKIESLKMGTPDSRLNQSCQVLEEADLLCHHENNLDSTGSSSVDYKRLFYVDSVELGAQWLSNSDSVGLHRVWNLWDHEFAAYFSQSDGMGLPANVSLGAHYLAGLAFGREGRDFSTSAVDANFYNKIMNYVELSVPFPGLLPPFEAKQRGFYMSPWGTTPLLPDTAGVSAGVGIGAGAISLPEDMLITGFQFFNNGTWNTAQPSVEARKSIDTAMFDLLGIGGDTPVVTKYSAFDGCGDEPCISSYLEYNRDLPVKSRAELLALSILAGSGGINPVANLGATLTMALANVVEHNGNNAAGANLDETCLCRTGHCRYIAHHVRRDDTIARSRDFTTPPDVRKPQFRGDFWCGRRGDGSLYARADKAGFQSRIGPDVAEPGECSEAHVPAFGGAGPQESIRCCIKPETLAPSEERCAPEPNNRVWPLP